MGKKLIGFIFFYFHKSYLEYKYLYFYHTRKYKVYLIFNFHFLQRIETFRPLRSLIYQFFKIYQVIFARFGQKFRF